MTDSKLLHHSQKSVLACNPLTDDGHLPVGNSELVSTLPTFALSYSLSWSLQYPRYKLSAKCYRLNTYASHCKYASMEVTSHLCPQMSQWVPIIISLCVYLFSVSVHFIIDWNRLSTLFRSNHVWGQTSSTGVNHHPTLGPNSWPPEDPDYVEIKILYYISYTNCVFILQIESFANVFCPRLPRDEHIVREEVVPDV